MSESPASGVHGIGAKVLLFGDKPLSDHSIPSVYGAIEPPAKYVPLKEMLKKEHLTDCMTEVFDHSSPGAHGQPSDCSMFWGTLSPPTGAFTTCGPGMKFMSTGPLRTTGLDLLVIPEVQALAPPKPLAL